MASYHKHYYPEENSGICVVRRKGENDEDFLKRFRKKYSKSGIAKELKERMFYEKPSDKRRRKKMQSIRNIQREEEKLLEMRERYKKMKMKMKKNKYKSKRKEDDDDKRSFRQDHSEVPERDRDFRRASNS